MKQDKYFRALHVKTRVGHFVALRSAAFNALFLLGAATFSYVFFIFERTDNISQAWATLNSLYGLPEFYIFLLMLAVPSWMLHISNKSLDDIYKSESEAP